MDTTVQLWLGREGGPFLLGAAIPGEGGMARRAGGLLGGSMDAKAPVPSPRCRLWGAAGDTARCSRAAHGVERGRAPEPGLARRRGACAEPRRVPGEWGSPGVQSALRGCGVPSPGITPHIPSSPADHL